ncbi:MAG TPA: PAS domain-containing protein [Gammaproteobacteria bacterium]|nr:PAS domain-containing protein [Gammaproteobacteria bacterium]
MTALHPELARQLLQALPGPVALLNAASVLVWVNDAFAALAGCEPGECVGYTLDDFDLPLRMTLGAEARRVAAPGFSGSVLLFEGASGGSTVAGVLSREAALLRLEAEISRSRRYSNPLSCLVARIEDDARAYAALERMLRDQLRWVDVLARWSETELLVLLPETPARAATALCRKLATQARSLGVEVLAWGTSTWRRGDDAALFVARARAGERGAAWPLASARVRLRR